MQSQMMALLLTANGHKQLTFAFKFCTATFNIDIRVHTFELCNMHKTIFKYLEGKSQLQGAQVKATDLRAAAALILAGLVADGKI
jgi:UDP-N-acetylglucosamine 1-carboxyvinyltransferase